ncbi:MAG: hypothetical protein KZQ97_14890, partial [Candidatus Thiodiazotropha sp. (ex Dulcina madagascariensis)]|nr:hypothetical protein [Candidatus Thiodiazotropha sp. (ex Dulcina madagascariensis)]
AVGRLQRRFDALLQAGTLRLKVHYLVAGLIRRRVRPCHTISMPDEVEDRVNVLPPFFDAKSVKFHPVIRSAGLPGEKCGLVVALAFICGQKIK